MSRLRPALINRALLLAAAVLLLGGCTAGPKVFTNESPIADFGRYSTYTFADDLGTDEGRDVRTLMSQYLIDEVSGQLDSRGYTFVEQDADLTVNFDMLTQEKLRSVPTASYGGYYGYGRYPGWGYYGAYGDTYRITQFTEGSLSVTLIDSTTNGVVWEGIGVGRITDEVRENLGLSIREAVNLMFARFPYIAGSPAPVAQQSASTNQR